MKRFGVARGGAAWRLGLWALALSFSSCAGSRTSQAGDRQVSALQAENTRLRQELGRRNAQAKAEFNAATERESQLGVAGASCTAVAPGSGEPSPRSGVVLAKVKLGATVSALAPRFQNPRTVQGVRVANGTCETRRK